MKSIVIIFLCFFSGLSFELIGQPTLDEILIENNHNVKAQLLKEYLLIHEKDGIAHLWFANILNRKAFYKRNISKNISNDFTTESLDIINTADSALVEYTKAASYLTALDVKKNWKYFKEYERKDLKTGATGVKYEDVAYDIESRKGKLSSLLLETCRTNRAADITSNQPILNQMGETEPIKTLGKYFALIIGVSDYENYKLSLIRPAIDAEKIKNLLTTNYTFDGDNIDLLLNPTRQDILTALFSLRKKLTKNDNLLIFYAGHGMYDEDAGQGYWWPRDADSESPSNWLSNSDLRDQIRSLKCSHTLLIADACFSGGIFRSRGTPTIKDASFDIISLYKLPSRRAITSGTMTTVPDNSIFFDYLYKALDKNESLYLSSQFLFDQFRLNVINNTLQVPQDGIISETGDEGGDFIFIKRK